MSERLILLRNLYDLAAEKNGYVSHARDQVASGLFRQLRRELFLLVLEIVKFDLYEFFMLKGMIDGREELRGQTVFPHPKRGFHPLRPGFEIAHLCITKRNHGSKLHSGRAMAEEFLDLGAVANSLAWSAPFGKAKAIQRQPRSSETGLDPYRRTEPNHYDRENWK